MNDVLSQEEIDALLDGVHSGNVETETDTPPAGAAQTYDFTQQDRVVRGRLPTLEMINDRFARYFRAGLFNVLRKACEVSVEGISMTKFAEYVNSLEMPSNLNLTRMHPLRGTALTVLEPGLVFSLVDNFFGGDGRFHARIEGREFTPTEHRVIQLVRHEVFAAMAEAWSPVMKLDFEFVNSEINPQFANIVGPTETVVVSRFRIGLDGGGGQVQITMPYAMVEPIRELLDGGVQSEHLERDERWTQSLHEEVLDAEVEITALLARASLSLRDFMALRPGDVITVPRPDRVTVYAEDVPVFRGRFGAHAGNKAIGFEQLLRRPELPAGIPDNHPRKQKEAEQA
jgi:flagellar motor switch protein FliM